MNKIQKLDTNLANQIAAGEVVERPVSIVKELLENSIDAGATQIKVEIKGGGIEEIIITDNGEGISKDDLPLTIEKYSTSKISSLEDLYNIMTFGFRGEALASISSVSKFQIISKTGEAPLGYALEVNGGEDKKITDAPAENGTKIKIKNLFYNTPARLHYLKKERTEYNHILECIHGVALAYPSIGFEFISDGKKIEKYSENEDLKTRIYSIYGESFSDFLIPVEFSMPGLEVSGYISSPKTSYANKNKQVLFVNSRIIKSPLIYRAIADAYNRYIPHGTSPAYVLNINIDPTQVDVNVHPRKLEIRFANEQEVFRTVYHAVEDNLKQVSLITTPQVETNNLNTIIKEETPKYYTGSGTKFKSYSPYKDTTPNPAQGQIKSALDFTKSILDTNIKEQNTGPVHDFADLHETPVGRIIGQVHNSYIVVQTENGMQILDQHALAERVIYEKLVSGQYRAKTQGLLLSESLHLGPNEIDILEENKQTFEDMGFDFEILSGNNIMINGIPDFIKKEDISKVFEGILSDIGEQNFNKSTTLEEVRNKIFSYTACRSAIKFGNKLNLFEMNKLLCDSVLDYSLTCPHGRPVVFEIRLDELKDRYER